MQAEEPNLNNSFASETLPTTDPPLDTPDENSSSQSRVIDRLEDVVPEQVQQTEILTSAGTITIISPIVPVSMDVSGNNTSESPNKSVLSIGNETVQLNENVPMDVSTELIATPTSGHTTIDKTIGLTSPTTPSVPKERKKRIIIDDDDESPTFNPLRSTKKSRGKNRRKQLLLKKQQRKAQLLSPSSAALGDKANESAVFTSPEGIVSTFSK